MTLEEIQKQVVIRTEVSASIVSSFMKESTETRLHIFSSKIPLKRDAIQRKIHNFFFRKECSTINEILKNDNEDDDLAYFK